MSDTAYSCYAQHNRLQKSTQTSQTVNNHLMHLQSFLFATSVAFVILAASNLLQKQQPQPDDTFDGQRPQAMLCYTLVPNSLTYMQVS